MKEIPPKKTPTERGFFERLIQAVSNEPKDRKGLLELLREAEQSELLSADALGMIEGVLQVSEMQVRDIMVPRSQMIVLLRDAQPEELLPVVTESGHSRFPVVGETRDEIEGILLAKDLLGYCAVSDDQPFSFRDYLRTATFVPESKRLNVLLKDFRSSRNHMAVVVDEYGGVAGLVTIEDVLEQIVGEIDDEHDIEEESSIVRQSPERYTVKARTPLDEFCDYFQCELTEGDMDTVGGMMIQALGHVPQRGETLELENMTLKVLRADSRRLHLLRVTLTSK